MAKRMAQQKGFTLIEIMVAVSIFVIVMLIAVGALLNAVDANKKAQSLNVIVNNLNLTFESMVRDLRTGKNYDTQSCGTADCVKFNDKDGLLVTYSYRSLDKALYITQRGLTGKISSDEVILSSVNFDLRGDGDRDGPERILIQIKGAAGLGKTKSEFNIQTLVTSRMLDLGELTF